MGRFNTVLSTLMLVILLSLLGCNDTATNSTTTNQDNTDDDTVVPIENPVSDNENWEAVLNDSKTTIKYYLHTGDYISRNADLGSYEVRLRDFFNNPNRFWVYLYAEPYQNYKTMYFADENWEAFLTGNTTYSSNLDGNYGTVRREFNVECTETMKLDTLIVTDLNFNPTDSLVVTGLTDIIKFEICK